MQVIFEECNVKEDISLKTTYLAAYGLAFVPFNLAGGMPLNPSLLPIQPSETEPFITGTETQWNSNTITGRGSWKVIRESMPL